jgi:hypothetical protein
LARVEVLGGDEPAVGPEPNGEGGDDVVAVAEELEVDRMMLASCREDDLSRDRKLPGGS